MENLAEQSPCFRYGRSRKLGWRSALSLFLVAGCFLLAGGPAQASDPPGRPDLEVFRLSDISRDGRATAHLVWIIWSGYDGTITGWDVQHGSCAGDGPPTLSAWEPIEGATARTSKHTIPFQAHVGGSYIHYCHLFRVRAVAGTLVGEPSNQWRVDRHIGRPDALTATNVGATSVGLRWTPPRDYPGTELKVEKSTDGGGSWGTVVTLGSSESEYTVNGLSEGTGYLFRVVNVDEVSVPSAELQVTTPFSPPGAPANVAAAAGDRSATLTWTAPAYGGAITGWQYRHGSTQDSGRFKWGGWKDISGATASAASHKVNGLVNGQAHRFQVRALAGDLEGAGSAIAAVMLPVRATVFGLQNGDLRISDGPSDKQGRLEVYRNGGWGAVCDDHFGNKGARVACKQMGYAGGREDHTERGLPPGMGFLLDDTRCKGSEATLDACPHNGWGIHNCSAREAASVTCTGTRPPPQVTVTDVGLSGTTTDHSAHFSWTIPDNRDIERIYLETLDAAGAVVSSRGTGSVSTKDLGTVRKYIMDGLSADTTYRFRVQLLMDDDSHENSNVLTMRTQTGASVAPTGLSATAGTGSISLAWTIPAQPAWVTKAEYVQIRREMTAPQIAAEVEIDRVTWQRDQTSYSFVDTGVVPGRTYRYRILMVIGAQALYSDRVTVAMPAAVSLDTDGTRDGATVLNAAAAMRYRQFRDDPDGIDTGAGDRVDYYKFTLPREQVLGLGVRGQILDASGHYVDLDATLENAAGDELMKSWPPPVDATVEWMKITLAAGTYYVRVDAPKGGATPYYIRYGFSDPQMSLSVADASAQEDSGSLVFTVLLDSAATRTLTVDYFTEDGTAVAVDDYSPRVGRLTFSPGDRTKTISVPIVNDSIDEGSETMTLRLTNPQGASISDGVATGTINNSDPLQKMWLSRFGHMVGSQIVDEVSDRLARPLEGAQVTVGGRTLDLAQLGDAQALTGLAQAFGEGGGVPLMGTSFHIAFGAESDGPAMVSWGRVASLASTAERDYRAGSLRLDNEVVTGIMGFDAQWSHGIAGVALSLSEGRSSFAQQDVDAGTVEASLTTATPYAQLRLGEGFHVWGLAGFGTGDMAIRQDRSDRVTRTDIEMQLSAVGARGDLMRGKGLNLALKADAFMVQMASDRAPNTVATEAETSRMRVMLEASRRFALGGDAALVPGLELGLRQDGGDTESGAGVEIGASLAWAHPASNMEARLNARTFMGQGDSDYEEWGVSGSLHIGGDAAGRGFLMSMTPTLGAAMSGADRLWAANDASRLAAEGGFEAEGRFDAELGFGMPAFTRLTGTPYAGLGLSEGGRDWRLGWRLMPGSLPLDFSLGVETTLTEPANDSDPEHGAVLQVGVRW